MQHPPGITNVVFANRPCWRLSVAQGSAVVAQHGGQVLSWTPAHGQEVLWLSALVQDPPAAARGGIPVCWPWFGKQGMPEGAMQHGPVRNRPWQRVGTPVVSASHIQLELQPTPAAHADDPLARFAAGLDVRLRITLDTSLTLDLITHNRTSAPFVLTQALHTYLAVADVRHVSITELAHLPYHDKLTGATNQIHTEPWCFDGPCDRIYHHTTAAPDRHYTVHDASGQRRIGVQTQGSASVVLWNPGSVGAQTLADVTDTAWTAFVCLEAANAGADTVTLAPGATHTLTQRLSLSPSEPAA